MTPEAFVALLITLIIGAYAYAHVSVSASEARQERRRSELKEDIVDRLERIERLIRSNGRYDGPR